MNFQYYYESNFTKSYNLVIITNSCSFCYILFSASDLTYFFGENPNSSLKAFKKFG